MRSAATFLTTVILKVLRTANVTNVSLRRGFTLIELLTVIGIIAILASLLMSGLSGAKKRARIAKCTSNMRQVSIALNLYLDDSGNDRPYGFESLVVSGQLENDAILRCPEDRTTGWGNLVQAQLGRGSISDHFAEPVNVEPRSVAFSFLHPFAGPESLWRSVLNQQSRTGFATCQLHGIGEARPEAPSIFALEGTVLRGQLDGSVVKRQHFWERAPIDLPPEMSAPAFSDLSADFPVGLFIDPGTVIDGE